MSYDLEGRILEMCTCNVLCPCWVGEDPDLGYCDGLLAWQLDKGKVNNTDVTGRTLVVLAHIPGNILKGNFRARIFVDDKATAEQRDALVSVWSGKEGGPVADLAKLVGEVVSVEQVPISFQVKGASGTLKVGNVIDAGLKPFQGATGRDTSLHDAVFSTIPGSPAYVGKATHLKVNDPDIFQIDIQGHNAISGSFRFVA